MKCHLLGVNIGMLARYLKYENYIVFYVCFLPEYKNKIKQNNHKNKQVGIHKSFILDTTVTEAFS